MSNYEEIYKEGYLDGLEYVHKILDKTLSQDAIDMLPGRIALQVLRATLTPEWDRVYE